ncbi:Retrovirus-related Pol polyprotein from transposon TNT 1-94 [Cardamine amara subsp. amara]|uniref:Retrovirus-related Pol polyprotein from transposon TNT 1-94 n=1 Tax=Cardamine amara subsp. amara TaxID=228776 RepID=A0ABD0ZYH7_CARAN
MSNTRVEVDRFDGTGDFSLWKVRMLAHFGVLGLKEILTDEQLLKDSTGSGEEAAAAEKDSQTSTAGDSVRSPSIDPAKFEKSEKAKDLIVLNVGNQVLRKITNCETAAAMWSTLNRLYMETSLPNRIYLQLKFYTFKMTDSKSIDGNVDEFLKLVADLSNIGVEVTRRGSSYPVIEFII